VAREKVFRTLGLFPKDTDRDLLGWLAAESAARKVAGEGYEFVSHAIAEVPVAELPPKALRQAIEMGIDPGDYLWLEQSTVGRVNEAVVDWLVAECKWRRDQLGLWVAAEQRWRLMSRA
jgi:hypothetical protein